MKKKYLTYAGIISAGILIFMFISIFIYGAFLVPTPGSTNSTSDERPQDSHPTPTSHSGSCARSSRFMTIDNLPDLWMNQTYNITGTTDLTAGEKLFVQVLPLEYNIDINPKSQFMTGNISGALGMVTVVNGTGGINLWSFELQTGQLDPNPRNYLVNVSNDRFDPRTSAIIYGDAFCTQSFTLKG